MKRAIFTCAALALLSTAATASPPRAPVSRTGSVTFEADFSAPSVSVGPDGLAGVRLAGSEGLRSPGAPALPYRTVRLALPPDAVLSTVRVSVTAPSAAPLAGAFDVRPAPPLRLKESGRAILGEARGRIADGRDTAIYGREALYPASWGAATGGANEVRGFKAIEVVLHPVRYSPASGRLVAADLLRVELRFRTEPGRGTPAGRACSVDDDLAPRLLDNFGEAKAWYASACDAARAPGGDGVAVITTAEIAAASAESLAAWAAMRTAQGHTVRIATEADWDFPTGSASEDGRADRIRKWLQDQLDDAEFDLGWVLLIGNPDPSEDVLYSVPMKLCAEYDLYGTGVPEIVPTDYYFADLTSDFDLDGDGIHCESHDSVAFSPDVYVGRLPVYSDGPAAVDGMIARILAYEEESATGDVSWRRRLLLPDSIYWFQYEGCDVGQPRWDGAVIGEWFIRSELRPRGIDWTTLYEREGLQPSQFDSHFAINSQNVVDQWVRGYGMVYWAGHGSEAGVYRTVWPEDTNGNGCADQSNDIYETASPEFMTQGFTSMLEDAPPPFVVHDSCSNATPESPDNLAYSLLRRGAIATVAATRVAFAWHFPEVDPESWEKAEAVDGDSSDMGTEFAQRVLDGAEAGRAHNEMIATTSNAQGNISIYQKSNMNLYGDPLVRLVMCRAAADCANGSFCDGVELCDDGACKPGTAIACSPTAECAEMVCSDEAAACVPGASCVADAGPIDSDTAPDAGTDAGPGVTGIDAATGMCSLAPRGAVKSLLSALL